jgi:hypothetical protein
MVVERLRLCLRSNFYTHDLQVLHVQPREVQQMHTFVTHSQIGLTLTPEVSPVLSSRPHWRQSEASRLPHWAPGATLLVSVPCVVSDGCSPSHDGQGLWLDSLQNCRSCRLRQFLDIPVQFSLLLAMGAGGQEVCAWFGEAPKRFSGGFLQPAVLRSPWFPWHR